MERYLLLVFVYCLYTKIHNVCECVFVAKIRERREYSLTVTAFGLGHSFRATGRRGKITEFQVSRYFKKLFLLDISSFFLCGGKFCIEIK